MTCGWCGTALLEACGPRNRAKYCKDACRKAAKRAYFKQWRAENPDYLKNWRRENPEYQREWRKARPDLNAVYNEKRRKPSRQAKCDECGADFETARADQRFCGDRCSRKFWRRESEAKKTPEQRWDERRRANKQRRRARKKTGVAGDVIRLAELRERDGSRCGICGKRVGTKAWPHPQSASIDHIVPLAQDGPHEWANVQLAHLRCNVAKGARGGGEQLRLVG